LKSSRTPNLTTSFTGDCIRLLVPDTVKVEKSSNISLTVLPSKENSFLTLRGVDPSRAKSLVIRLTVPESKPNNFDDINHS
jgi:hypothetical protein